EYTSYDKPKKHKWEACRGIGNSFGYNRMETPDMYLTLEELIHMFVDIVSKNGNLLLNVGPKADGTISEIQVKRLLGLGKWLSTNGEAIYKTRPWDKAAGITERGLEVRYTRTEENLYAIILGNLYPSQNKNLIIHNIEISAQSSISILGNDQALSWKKDGSTLTLTLPESMPKDCAIAIKINPCP
ncbi:MAG: alpha-L-fucosidase, partial [Candidatus Lokiarchaeota archaeon]|nr:alpha-L-fucosidase [Candidatus Lokiarchaeota archaeon]